MQKTQSAAEFGTSTDVECDPPPPPTYDDFDAQFRYHAPSTSRASDDSPHDVDRITVLDKSTRPMSAHDEPAAAASVAAAGFETNV